MDGMRRIVESMGWCRWGDVRANVIESQLGYTLRQLDIHSLELLMPIAPAAPLCHTSSDNEYFDGLQVASKGGQIGAPNYFIQVLEGKV